MKLTPWFLAAIAPLAVVGCSGTLLGHVAVLAVTFGIFIGTLSLGRHTAQTPQVQSAQAQSTPIVTPLPMAPLSMDDTL